MEYDSKFSYFYLTIAGTDENRFQLEYDGIQIVLFVRENT